MKINELFDKGEEHGGEVTSSTFGYHVKKQIGDRLMQFEAARSGETWEVAFGEKMKNGGIKYDSTGTGDEIKVFSFIVASMRAFIKKYDPKRIQFSVRKVEGSKKSLYSKLVDRFAKDAYIAREFEIGLGSAEKYIEFDLIKKPTNEALKDLEAGFDAVNSKLMAAAKTKGGKWSRTKFDSFISNEVAPAFGLKLRRRPEWHRMSTEVKDNKVGSRFKIYYYLKLSRVEEDNKEAVAAFRKELQLMMEAAGFSDILITKEGTYSWGTSQFVTVWGTLHNISRNERLNDEWVVKEGMMKRSNPFVSGELELPKARERSVAPTPVSTNVRVEKMLKNLAQRANVDVSVVRKARDEIMKDVDSKHPNRWNIIMSRLNRRLGL